MDWPRLDLLSKVFKPREVSLSDLGPALSGEDASRMPFGVGMPQEAPPSTVAPAGLASAGASMLPGAGVADVLGYLPNFQGGTYPSFGQNIQAGRYGQAGLQGLGLAGDMMLALPGLAPLGELAKVASGAKEARAATETAASKTPAQDLLARNHAGTETLADVEARLTPKQLDMIREAGRREEALPTTQQLYSDGNGVYTPERAQLHNDMIEKMFTPEEIAKATPAAGERPLLVLTGGRPAAGKTTTLQNELKDIKDRTFYLSADKIQEGLPGYDPSIAGVFNKEAQDIALQAEKYARDNGLNLAYDATLKSQKPALDRVQAYKDAGYDVHGYFVHTSPVTSGVRSAQRYEAENRYVPPAVSLNSLTNEKTFDALIPHLKKWAIYNNEGAKPELYARGENP